MQPKSSVVDSHLLEKALTPREWLLAGSRRDQAPADEFDKPARLFAKKIRSHGTDHAQGVVRMKHGQVVEPPGCVPARPDPSGHGAKKRHREQMPKAEWEAWYVLRVARPRTNRRRNHPPRISGAEGSGQVSARSISPQTKKQRTCARRLVDTFGTPKRHQAVRHTSGC